MIQLERGDKGQAIPAPSSSPRIIFMDHHVEC